MKKILLITMFFFVGSTAIHPNLNLNGVSIDSGMNDKTFSFELAATAAQQSLKIISDVKEPMMIKIVDKSGFIRIQKELHLDREIDLTSLREGLYLIKVHVGNHMEVKRFYKGRDGIAIR
ncbi:hypothetical protein ACWGOQ_0013865 [Aquimarina sp. M1]